MTVLRLALGSLRLRLLGSVLTVLGVALGVALVVAVLSLRASTRSSFLRAARGYDVVLGPAQGAPLQTVLSTLFHVGDAAGTLPFRAWEEARADSRVLAAIPYVVGDSFRGHQVVGTTADLFSTLTDGAGRPLGEGIAGRLFGPSRREAVIGVDVARKAGLRMGHRFRLQHGVEDALHEHAEEWQVVGLLRPTGTPADRALFIPLLAFYTVSDHQEGADALRERREAAPPAATHHGHDHDEGTPETNAEAVPPVVGSSLTPAEADQALKDARTLGLSAVGLKLKSPYLRLAYTAEVRQDSRPWQAIQPMDAIQRLLIIVGSVDQIFQLLGMVVVLVAALGILVGLWNSLQGRRREIAILRALGAGAHRIFALLLLEALLLALLGGVLGLFLGRLGLYMAAPHLLSRYAVHVEAAFGGLDLAVLGVLTGVGLLTGLLPALRGLATPVARNLHPID